MNKQYVKIRLELKKLDTDLLSSLFFQAGALGIEEYSDEIWFVYFPQEFESGQFSALIEHITRIQPHFSPEQVAATYLPTQDWNVEWRKYFRPIKIGKRVWVAPPWDKPHLSQNELLVIVDPQMAFGTGGHETTQLMVEALQNNLSSGVDVLDAGTGSGILAILAKKLGAGQVVGFDIECEAIENANHNAQLNGVSGIEFLVGNKDTVSGRKFDLLLANINRNVLMEILPALKDNLKPNGKLIISGILIDDEKQMIKATSEYLEVIDKLQKNEWQALVFRKL